MRQHTARLLVTAFCLTATQAHALEADRQQAMSQACGLTAGRQQLYVIGQTQSAAPADAAGLARYRELLRYSSASAREAARTVRTAEPALLALDNQSFDEAVNLGIVLQSEPAIAAQATRQFGQQIPAESPSDSEQLAVLREAWTALCLQQLKGGTTLARRRELSLCNTFAVVGLMQRQRFDPKLEKKISREQIEGMLTIQPEARSLIADTLALSWVDDEMKSAAILRATVIAAEAPLQDVSGFRELAQQLAKDPLRQPYGDLCEAMASGARPVPASPLAGAPAAGRSKYELVFRPNLAELYPPESVRDKEQGNVTVSICFDAKGNVTETTVKESSGSRALDRAAIKAGMMYRIKPGMVNFVPQGTCVDQQLRFSLQ
jgi:TonB family protein